MSIRRAASVVFVLGFMAIGAWPQFGFVQAVLAQGACGSGCTGIVWGSGGLTAGFKYVVSYDPLMSTPLTDPQKSDVRDFSRLAAANWTYEANRRGQGALNFIEFQEGGQGANDVKIFVTDAVLQADYDADTKTVHLPRSTATGGEWAYRIAVIMHEFGHALGAAGANCDNSVMSPTTASSYRSYFTDCDQEKLTERFGAVRRDDDSDGRYADEDCDDTNSNVWDNCTDSDGDGHYAIEDCDDQDSNVWQNCAQYYCEQQNLQWNGSVCLNDSGTPIIIPFGTTRELRLTPPDVLFDLDADGVLELIAWTERGADVGFLVLDRNGNGRIDDGAELFGDATPQPASVRRNGFVALAVFDTAAEGGNGDGWIDSADAVYARLRVWTDINHDGVSQDSELSTLSAASVTRMSLDFRLSSRTDRWRNVFRYRSKAEGPRTPWIYDVLLRIRR